MAHVDTAKPSASGFTDDQHKLAMERFAMLQPHLENDVPLASAARHGGISIRTAERCLARYRQDGMEGSCHP